MARRISRKELKQDEFMEAAVETGHWIERHLRSVVGGVVAAFVIVLAVVGWQSWSRSRAERASERLAQGITAFERALSGPEAERPAALERALADFDRAIDGAATGTSEAVARYYRAAALGRLGRSDEAIEGLRSVIDDRAAPPTLAASARGLLARSLADAGRADEALAVLDAALAAADSLLPPDHALLEIGRIHAAAGRTEQAAAAWRRLREEYPTGSAASEAGRLLGES